MCVSATVNYSVGTGIPVLAPCDTRYYLKPVLKGQTLGAFDTEYWKGDSPFSRFNFKLPARWSPKGTSAANQNRSWVSYSIQEFPPKQGPNSACPCGWVTVARAPARLAAPPPARAAAAVAAAPRIV